MNDLAYLATFLLDSLLPALDGGGQNNRKTGQEEKRG